MLAGNFIIGLREGLEIFLLLGIIIITLTKVDKKNLVKYVYVGFGIAMLCGALMDLSLRFFANMLETDYLIVGAEVLAAIMITGIIIWMIAKGNKFESEVKEMSSNNSTKTGIATLAFLVTIREAAEIVLMMFAVGVGESDFSAYIVTLAGLIVALTIAVLFSKGMLRFKLSTFFKVTTILLIFIAAGIFSHAVSSMEKLEIINKSEILFDLTNISPIFHNKESLPGAIMYGVFGYTHLPTLYRFTAWLVYLIVIFGFYFYFNHKQKLNHKQK